MKNGFNAQATRERLQSKYGDKADVKVIPSEISTDESDPMLFTARITKNISDRDDEALLPKGMIASEFDQSGAVFWNHDYDRPIAVPEGKLASTNDAVMAKARFMARPDDFVGEFFPDFARAFVGAMSEAGRKAGVSVGFLPEDTRPASDKDKEEYGPEVKTVFTRWKLLEWSIAPVQSNPEAFVTAVGKSLGVPACRALFGVEPEAAVEDVEETAYRLAMMAKMKRMSRRARRDQAAERKRAQRERRAVEKARRDHAVYQGIARAKGLVYV